MEPHEPSVAQVCHEANAAYCRVCGDFSQPDWNSAPEWQKQSAIAGVEFHMANPTADTSASHESWLKQKEADGWKYGPVKDAEKKEHPCFVPYNELPFPQRVKDYIFRAIVHAFMDATKGENE
jgi:hypothetical protein